MFDMIDTGLSYERELVICSYLQDFSEGKRGSLEIICDIAHIAFLLCGAELQMCVEEIFVQFVSAVYL